MRAWVCVKEWASHESELVRKWGDWGEGRREPERKIESVCVQVRERERETVREYMMMYRVLFCGFQKIVHEVIAPYTGGNRFYAPKTYKKPPSNRHSTTEIGLTNTSQVKIWVIWRKKMHQIQSKSETKECNLHLQNGRGTYENWPKRPKKHAKTEDFLNRKSNRIKKSS